METCEVGWKFANSSSSPATDLSIKVSNVKTGSSKFQDVRQVDNCAMDEVNNTKEDLFIDGTLQQEEREEGECNSLSLSSVSSDYQQDINDDDLELRCEEQQQFEEPQETTERVPEQPFRTPTPNFRKTTAHNGYYGMCLFFREKILKVAKLTCKSIILKF